MADLQEPQQAIVPLTDPEKIEEVERTFWQKLRRVMGRIPFAEDLVAAYYCAIDSSTPTRVRGILLAALAYFILPTDLIPDFITGLGFTDDATVLATTLGIVSSYIKPAHRTLARKSLDLPPIPETEDV